MKAMPQACRVIFVTGTDTGVGKTLLTGLLLHHLRQKGTRALAMKPFCSGGTADVRFLQALQRGELADRDMNPFYFPKPVAPLVATRKAHRDVTLSEAVKRIQAVARRCPRLLIEGSGGLFVPLGEGYTVAELIARLNGAVVVVSRNRLGTINHTLLTVRALQAVGQKQLTVVLMGCRQRDASTQSNAGILAEWLFPVPLVEIPFLGPGAARPVAVRKHAKKLKKVLARILD